MSLAEVFTPAAGSVTTVTVAADSVAIEVYNGIPALDLWVQFGPLAMPLAPAQTTASAYRYRVASGEAKTLPLPAAFDGHVFVGAYGGVGRMPSGTSSTGFAAVTPYAPGEAPLAAMATTVGTDLTSQPRVIALPTFGHLFGSLSGGTLTPASPCALFLDFGVGAYGRTVTAYLYNLVLSQVGARYAHINLSYGYALPAGGVYPVVEIGVLMLTTGRSVNFLTDGPIAAMLTTPAGVSGAGVIVSLSGLGSEPAGASIQLTATASADIDDSGTPPPPSVGNGAATPGGTVY